MTRSSDRSEQALAVIPLGAQTFSKSNTQFPLGVSPYFVERAKGSRLWDVDGNEYIDFINALCSVTLGYCDPDVDGGRRARSSRTARSSRSPIGSRCEVAETVCELVPCAEMVRFGKNGSDATAGAVRAARAFTGRERVAACGYHGWQDWYIGATARNKGVPAGTRALTHTFRYNDLAVARAAVLDEHPGEFAAVILEPMNVPSPARAFSRASPSWRARHGAC